jgi:cysteinyl-tRNA synthetase
MFLLAEYKAGRLDSVLSTLSIADIRTAALESYAERKLPLMPKGAAAAEIRSKMPKEYTAIMDWHKLTDAEAKIKMYIETVLQASQALTANQSNKVATEEDMKSLDDVIMPFLDGLYLENKFGRLFDPADHAIFTQLTKKYEQRFSEDMRALNVMDPDGLTRVTEYGRNIVDFVQRIEQNQCAYPVDGSVYFDINAFEAAKNQYMRLEPENYGNKKRSAEGEGALTVKPKTRSDADFVLWKKSKFGEPSWSSPWGEGRPGWHIECSAMASDKLGEQMDIHSGGIDLAFPHHDNELAQSEAYWNKEHQHQRQWVNYCTCCRGLEGV